MRNDRNTTISTWLGSTRGGEPGANRQPDELGTPMAELVYDELRQMASNLLRHERAGHTLQPTALVNEAYLQLLNHTTDHPEARNRFFALAARVMRHVLIDHARARGRQKRGGDAHKAQLTLQALSETQPTFGPEDLLALDEALQKLEQLDERKARLVELRYFAGLEEETTAQILGISRSTASADWRFARAWLLNQMTPGQDPPTDPPAPGAGAPS